MSGADSDPDIKPSLTDAEISRFIGLVDIDRLRSYNFTEDDKSRIVALFDPDSAIPEKRIALMIGMSIMSPFYAGFGLHCIYKVLKDFLPFAYNGINIAAQKKQAQLSERCISLSRYSRTPDLKGLKDIGETYFAETYTVFRQESQDNFK
ncbi:uncharacterized protein LOC123906812 isoform X1 [Trifolium pratense]|uniref:uncharacterized protein LOC123906812 isoform X1 n=1 Tax=Trifolium pratense TaxID=57577 RepID=UPI001E696067|nr:uncharacterized protein LOC123906812 isoform X1 [Trifolium pratense]